MLFLIFLVLIIASLGEDLNPLDRKFPNLIGIVFPLINKSFRLIMYFDKVKDY